jgi:hypothetical protein
MTYSNWQGILKAICSYQPCQQKVFRRGFCNKHDGRYQRHGDPGIVQKHTVSCDCYDCVDRPIGTKRCNICGECKPLAQFHRSKINADGHRRNCINCGSAANIKFRYGLTQEVYNAILKTQGNSCAICSATEPGHTGAWYVDHDHACCPGAKTCGKCIRGLLCFKCNVLLGMAQDDIAVLKSAMSYLMDRR